jgi:hypothetical protein
MFFIFTRVPKNLMQIDGEMTGIFDLSNWGHQQVHTSGKANKLCKYIYLLFFGLEFACLYIFRVMAYQCKFSCNLLLSCFLMVFDACTSEKSKTWKFWWGSDWKPYDLDLGILNKPYLKVQIINHLVLEQGLQLWTCDQCLMQSYCSCLYQKLLPTIECKKWSMASCHPIQMSLSPIFLLTD